VTALLRNKLWAYPWMIAFLGIFIVYQLYRIALTPTLWLITLTVFDGLIVWLTYREYRNSGLAYFRATPCRTRTHPIRAATHESPAFLRNAHASNVPATSSRQRVYGRSGSCRHAPPPSAVAVYR
jgi:Predicted membrane protein (DUF2127)